MSHFLYRMVIAYDGTDYGGWQVQPNAVTIQEVLQKILSKILQEQVLVTGSGRTDAGVHATGQVGHFSSTKELDKRRVLASLNRLLPVEIRIRKLDDAPENFHARYSAKGKIYHYHLTTGYRDPFRSRYATFHPYSFDVTSVKKAATFFVGKHDFTTFANESHAGSAARNPIRTIHRLDVIEEEHGFRFEFEGEGFLYKMVRNIMGTLMDVGGGKLQPEDIEKLLAAKDRRKAGKTAPPQGLFLIQVCYEGWPQMLDNGALHL